MKRGTLACTVAVLCLPGYYLWQGQLPSSPATIDEMERWQPDAAAIQSSLATEFGKNLTPKSIEAKKAFALAFQQRYRTHATQLAVGLHFRDDGTVRLFLPSRLEPWYMNKIALAAYRETRDTFHQSEPINLYETFAGAAPVRIGYVCLDATDTRQIRIAFDYSHSPNRVRKP